MPSVFDAAVLPFADSALAELAAPVYRMVSPPTLLRLALPLALPILAGRGEGSEGSGRLSEGSPPAPALRLPSMLAMLGVVPIEVEAFFKADGRPAPGWAPPFFFFGGSSSTGAAAPLRFGAALGAMRCTYAAVCSVKLNFSHLRIVSKAGIQRRPAWKSTKYLPYHFFPLIYHYAPKSKN